jgi:hypothetical protein
MLTRTPSELLDAAAEPRPARRPRDPRLDFFRGIGMFIILIAHIPYDLWALYIPARFGFSDATEMFVFQSGMASAIAFGSTFERHGFLMLTARVGQRIWQIYWAHVSVFIAIAALMVVFGTRPDGITYVNSLNLDLFMQEPGPLLVSLLTLRYVPNYFDILPMYMVILALMPVMLLAARLHIGLALALMAGLWLAAQLDLASLSAEPWSDRAWFFNPFGWQLLFFAGFFLMKGAIAVPGRRLDVTLVALAVVALSVPFAWVRWQDLHPVFQMVALEITPLTDKTDFGLLRFVHFLALAYLAVQAVGENGRYLKGRAVKVVTIVGQQSLAVFIAGMVLAQVIGFVLDQTDRGLLVQALANLSGFALLVAVAYLVRWFKQTPWKG